MGRLSGVCVCNRGVAAGRFIISEAASETVAKFVQTGKID